MSDGSIAHPWSLAYALQSPFLRPGATVYLRGGTYTGRFRSYAQGVTFQAYPGEHVILDGQIMPFGSDCTFDGLEILNSGWLTRTSQYAGSGPADITAVEGFDVNADNITIQKCVIHDCRQGIITNHSGLTVRDCLFYNNGWSAPDRGHGHSIYINNAGLPATIERNIFVHDYDDWGIHGYSEVGAISNITVRDNVSIGKIALYFTTGLMDDITLDGNESWRAKTEIGQASRDHFDVTVTRNYLVGATPWYPLVTRRLKRATVRGNTLVADGSYAIGYTTPNTDPPGPWIDWDANMYYQSAGTFIDDNNTPRTFAAWQAARGFDAQSTYTPALPTTNRIRTIDRADGKKIVVIYNWENLASVAAPLSGTYVNVQNPAESVTLAAGAALTMSGWTAAVPVGDTVAPYGPTFPQFGCFLVTP